MNDVSKENSVPRPVLWQRTLVSVVIVLLSLGVTLAAHT